MATGAHHGSLDDAVREGWVEALAQTAAFERPWVDDAVSWLLAGPVTAMPLPGPAIDVGAGAGNAAIALAHRLASPDSGAAVDGEVTHGGASAGRPLDAADGPGPTGRGPAGGDGATDDPDAPVVAVDRDPRLLALARRFAAFRWRVLAALRAASRMRCFRRVCSTRRSISSTAPVRSSTARRAAFAS
jgi:hypothetical protein